MMDDQELMNCDAYKKLLAAVEGDERREPRRDFRSKLAWIIERATQYATHAGVSPVAILTAWEAQRDYWYMNFYQEAKQPDLDNCTVRSFDAEQDAWDSFGDAGFRCPQCNSVATEPYSCNQCDWKAGGLFRTMGKGAFLFIKSQLAVTEIFMPVLWETELATGAAS